MNKRKKNFTPLKSIKNNFFSTNFLAYFGIVVILIGLVFSTYLVLSNKSRYISSEASLCCTGPDPDDCTSIISKEECIANYCNWVCSGGGKIPTCSSLGVTDERRQCRGETADIPGSRLCLGIGGKKKQCCTNNLSWAHGGCCNKNKVCCGTSAKYPELLLYCKGKNLSQYGNPVLKYKSINGICSEAPCE